MDQTNLTYSFPTSAADYESNYINADALTTLSGFTALQQTVAREVFDSFASISDLTFTELGDDPGEQKIDGDLRLARSDDPGTAYAYFPSDNAVGGDSMFNTNSYNSPTIGNYQYVTFLHEIGHALGLKHGHETSGPGAVPFEMDSMEFTIMTYRSWVGKPLDYGYANETWGYAQSLMMLDIAAIQRLYGADFETESGDTTYTFSTTTGEMFIDGFGVGTPGGNRIFRTIWDGDGTDTYDFSNYSTDLAINLQPGEYIDLDVGGNFQRAKLEFGFNGNPVTYSRGHIFNALQYEGDARSLIENANGGSGNDSFIGNAADNVFRGNGGNDTFFASLGSDTYHGGSGIDDVVYGGLFSSYSFATSGTFLQVIDGVIDWLADTIETIVFSDQVWSFGDLFDLASGGTTTPDAVNDAYSVGEDGSLNGANLLSNDSDPESDPLSVVAVNGQAASVGSQITLASGALLTVNADGTFSYDPNGAFEDLNDGESDTDSFTYTAGDGSSEDDATVTITINGATDNRAPGAVDDGYIVDEDAALNGNVLGNDSDPDGDQLTVTAVNGQAVNVGSQIILPSGALLTVNANGTFSYDQNGAFDGLNDGQSGNDSFTYTVEDPSGLSDTATANITVNGATDNRAPDAVNDGYIVAEDAALNGNVLGNDSDPDGDQLTVTAVNGQAVSVGSQITLASGALLTVNANGTFSYDQNGAFDGLNDGQNGNDSFTYTAEDPSGLSDTATASITVNGSTGNRAPDAVNDSYTSAEGAALNGNVLGNDSDPDGDQLTVTAVNGQAVNVGSQITLASGALLTVNANGTFSYDQNGAFDGLNDGQSGNDSFTYTTEDPSGLSDTATASITVNGATDNRAPGAVDDGYIVDEDAALNGNVLGNDSDPDGDQLTVTAVNGQAVNVGSQIILPSGALLTVNANGTFSYDQNGAFDGLNDGQSGNDSFTYTVEDPNGLSDTATASITVNGATDNQAPNAVNDDYTIAEDATLNGDVLTNDSDPDGEPLTVTSVNGQAVNVGSQITLASGALLTVNANGTFSYDQNGAFDGLNDGQSGNDSFTYTVEDPNGLSDTATASITVNGVTDNRAPDAVNDGYTADEGAALGGDVTGNDGDPDGDPVTVMAVNGLAANVGGQIVLASGALLTMNADGTFSYDQNGVFDGLNDGQTGNDSFTYTIEDPSGLSDTATVNISVNGASPVMMSEPVTVNFEGEVPGAYGGTDGLAFAGLSVQANSTLNGSRLGYSGSDGDFTITATGADFDFDGAIFRSTGGRVRVTVEAWDDGVRVGSSTFNTRSNRDTDRSFDLSFDSIDEIRVISNGEIYVDDLDFVTYTELDTGGGNNAPNAVNDTDSTLESGTASGNVLSNDSDPDGDGLSVISFAGGAAAGSLVTLASGATVSIQSDGSYSYDANGAFDHLNSGENATDSFDYQISDGNGGTDTATVSVTVNGEGTPPPAVILDFESGIGEAGFVFTDTILTTRAKGVASGNFAGQSDGNSLTISHADAFDFDSGYFTAVNGRKVTVEVEGYLDGAFVGRETFTVSDKRETFRDLNDGIFDNVDQVVITASGGVIVDDLTMLF